MTLFYRPTKFRADNIRRGLLLGVSVCSFVFISGVALAEPAPQILPGGASASSPVSVDPRVDITDEDAASADLDSVRARAFLGLRQLQNARNAANDVLETRPEDVPALSVLALAEETDDRWRQAAGYWSRIYTINGDEAAAARRDALIAAHPTQASVTGFFEGSAGVDAQYGVRASTDWRPLDGPEWMAMIESREADTDASFDLAGVVGPISDNRQRIDIGVADTLRIGRLSLNLLGAQNGVGARVGYGRRTRWGGIDLVGAVNESYWLYSAGIANEARTDYLGVSANLHVRGVGARLALRESSYGVKDDESLARSTRVTIGVDVPFSKRPNALRVSYVLDAENFSRIDQRTAASGLRYSPVPFADREVHSIGAFKGFGDVDRTHATLGGGYRYDRYGADGAFVSVSGEAAATRNIRIGARLEYSQTSIRGLSEDSYSFGEVYARRVF